jgi:hypothetical protein
MFFGGVVPHQAGGVLDPGVTDRLGPTRDSERERDDHERMHLGRMARDPPDVEARAKMRRC